MKKNHLLFLFLLSCSAFLAQTVIYTTLQSYNQQKKAGQLKPNARYEFLSSTNLNTPVSNYTKPTTLPTTLGTTKTATSSACQCMMPLDATFTVVPMGDGSIFSAQPPEYRNDDESSLSIPLGFNFCFYGSTYSSCFINNNGNITFSNNLAAFSAGGFPAGNGNGDTVMIAPFWGDVDTQGSGSGLVYYKQTPTALVIKWNNVGYFSSQDDKLNDFQLIITNGNDPILPNGNNVAFCYGDMQWTTGSASQGTNGFGGIPATAGVNKGDGINYVQLGRFDNAGISYDGPYGLNDGISFLDNKSYFFNTCGTNNNLPPIIQDPTGGGSACGDTIRICALGDTLVYTTSFLAPEGTQTVSVIANAPTLGSSFTPLGITNTSGGVSTFAWMVVASSTVSGVHTVIVTGTDNGNPPLSTSATYFIKIQNIPVPQPTLSISPIGTVCATPGATFALVNCTDYDNVYWSNGSSGCSIVVNSTGVYYVTVNKLGCYKSSSDTITVFPNPIPIVSGPLNYCSPATSTTLMLNPPTSGMANYTSISWIPSGFNTSTVALSSGNHIVTVTDANGCQASTSVSVTSVAPSVSITAIPSVICGAGTTTLIASISGADSYNWSNSSVTQSTTVNAGAVYGVTVTASGCVASNTINVLVVPLPTVTLPPTVGMCNGASAIISPTISPNGIYTYTWSNGSQAQNLSVFSIGNYAVSVTSNNGCKSLISNTCIVSVAPNPTVTIAGSPIIFCNGGFATLTSSVTSGTAGFNYNWLPSSLGTASTATTSAVGVFTLQVTDANLCKGSATVSTIKNTPSVTLSSPDLLLCPGDCTNLIASATSSFMPISYAWSNSSSNSTTITTCSIGTTTITITDAKGCQATNVITVQQDVLPVASFGSNPTFSLVPGEVITFTNTSTIAVGSIVNSSWSFGDGGTSSATNPMYNYNNASTYVVTLIVTGSNGCKDTVSASYLVEATLLIPNVITPNGDGINDYLKFNNLQVFTSNNLTIFNRWGKKIVEQSNYKNDWNASGFSDGTYFFILNVPDAKPQSYQGYFELIH